VTALGEDVRKDRMYAKYAGERVAHGTVTVQWLPEFTQDKQTGVPRLRRKVKTKVDLRTSSVHFMQGTLEHEAEYILERVRALA
jgi:hypothetical protein